MANTYVLRIVSQEAILYEGKVESLVAPGTEGYFGIWAHHAPFVSALKEGKLSFRESGDHQRTFQIRDGILEVANKGETTILTEDIQEVK